MATVRPPSLKPKGRTKIAKETKPDVREPFTEIVEVAGLVSRRKLYYDPTFHPTDYVQHCREGNTHSYILASWGIYDATFRLWVKKHQEFADAVKVGRVAFNGFWHYRLKEAILNKDKFMKDLLFIWFSKNTMGWGEQARDEFADAGPAMDFEIIDENTGEAFNAHMEKIEKK